MATGAPLEKLRLRLLAKNLVEAPSWDTDHQREVKNEDDHFHKLSLFHSLMRSVMVGSCIGRAKGCDDVVGFGEGVISRKTNERCFILSVNV